MVKLSNKVLCAFCLLIVAVVMYFLNAFTPLFCDDWHYRFIFGTQTPIRSIGDIIVSQWHHYFEFTNGRFFAHFFVQLFDGILGKGIFNVFNALFFAVFLYVLAVVTTSNKDHYYKIISVALILVFLLMTGFKYVFLWMSGSCNYLWMGIVVLLFNYLLFKESLPSKYNVLLFLLGVVAGWSNEAFVVGLGAAYFFYFAFHRKQLEKHRLYLLIGFYLGALFVVFCPASIHRAFASSEQQFKLLDRLLNMQNLRLFFVLIAVLVFKLAFRKLNFKRWIKDEQVLIIATIVSFVFILFTGYYYSHSRFGIELFSLVLLLRLIDWQRVDGRLITFGNVAVLAFAIYAIVTSYRCYEVNKAEIAQVASGENIIATTDAIEPTSYMRRFALDYLGYGINDGINDVKYYGEDDWIPKYYGLNGKFVYFWPQAFLDDLKKHYGDYNEFRTFGDLTFYAKRCLAEDKEYGYVQIDYLPSKYDSMPWPLNRLLSKLMGEVDSEVQMVKILPVNGENYVIVQKLHPSQSEHVEKIFLKN